MNVHHTNQIAANCSPVFSMAGVMPAASEMAWKTAYPNPDASTPTTRPAGHGVSLSIAGVMPGLPETAWRTANPDPSRDMLTASGHVISIAEGKVRAHLAPRHGILSAEASTVPGLGA